MNVKPHTINLLVGPSCCGKSHYAKEVSTRLASLGKKVHWLSSDSFRQFLIGTPHTKHFPRMMEVSEQAFDLLFSNLLAVTSYPVNSDYVFVDTTGLDAQFRSRVYDIAKQNNYLVELTLFLYKNREDYFAGLRPEDVKSVITKHMRKLYSEELQKITGRSEKSRYSNLNKITRRIDFNEFDVSIEITNDNVCHLDESRPTLIIGDVHGQYDKLVQLLDRAQVKIENGLFVSKNQIVFVGDIIDKASRLDTEKCLDLILPNIWKANAFSCIGNHERFFANFHRTDKTKDTPPEIIQDYFSSCLETDQAYIKKILELHDLSCLHVIGPGFVVTHSPCHHKYIGKFHGRSAQNQMNWRYTDLNEEEFNKSFSDLFDERPRCSPLHVFGHIPCDKVYSGRNWTCIDTNAVDGGKLTGVLIKPNNARFREIIQSDGEPVSGKNLRVKSANDLLTINDLPTGRERGRVHAMIENSVNFISGTMSPVGVIEDNLEDIRWGLDYYKRNGVSEVFLSAKMMGSRAQIYLFREASKSYLVSRNGFKVRDVPEEIFDPLINRFQSEFDSGLSLRILDAELMPWSFLGKGLIDQNFMPAYFLAKQENQESNRLGFYEKFKEVENFLKPEYGKIPKEEFCKMYGHHTYKMQEGFYSMRNYITSYEDIRGRLNTYKVRLDKYCGGGYPSLYPFAILKDVFDDAKEVVYGSGTNLYENFLKINNTEILKCSTDDVEGASSFLYEVGTSQLLEGVVMRPVIDVESIAPYFKIRHPDYLMLAYGFDYQIPVKLNKLVTRKKIGRKIRQSIDDYRAGMKMLQIPYYQISSSREIEDLFVRFIKEDVKEGIDPRL